MKKLVITLIIIVCSFSSKAQESKITGNWQLTQVEVNGEIETGVKAVFIFAEKGVLKAARNAASRTIYAGSWKYNKKEKTIVMTSDLDKDFNGEATVVKVNDKELVYKKDEVILCFIKLAKLNTPPKITMAKPILSIERAEMYNDEGSFNYEEAEAKLPWKIETIVNNLKDYTEMV